MVKDKGKDWALQHLTEALDKRTLRPEDFSIRDLARGLIDDGESWYSHLASPRGGFRTLTEAVNAVDTTAFSGITGQIIFNKLMSEYHSPEFLWPELVDVHSSTFQNGERIAGIGEIGDVAETIAEGESYQNAGLNEEFIDTPPTQKRGFFVPVTKEIVIGDRTGLLLTRAAKGGHWMGVNKEKRVLDCVLGVTNTYKRNGVATNTYLTSGAYTNSHSNALIDHTDVENSELLLDGMVDPNTGEPFSHADCSLLVPSALKKTALRIAQATEVAIVDNQANAATHRQWSPAPKPFYKGTWGVLSNPWVKARSGSASTWWFGNFKESFGYVSIWDIETQEAGATSEMALTHDILHRYRVSEKGVPYVKNPRRATKNT